MRDEPLLFLGCSVEANDLLSFAEQSDEPRWAGFFNRFLAYAVLYQQGNELRKELHTALNTHTSRLPEAKSHKRISQVLTALDIAIPTQSKKLPGARVNFSQLESGPLWNPPYHAVYVENGLKVLEALEYGLISSRTVGIVDQYFLFGGEHEKRARENFLVTLKKCGVEQIIVYSGYCKQCTSNLKRQVGNRADRPKGLFMCEKCTESVTDFEERSRELKIIPTVYLVAPGNVMKIHDRLIAFFPHNTSDDSRARIVSIGNGIAAFPCESTAPDPGEETSTSSTNETKAECADDVASTEVPRQTVLCRLPSSAWVSETRKYTMYLPPQTCDQPQQYKQTLTATRQMRTARKQSGK